MEKITELTGAVDALADEAQEIRGELRRRTRALWFAVVGGGVLLAIVLVAAFQVTLSNRQAISENNAQWCPMVSLLTYRPGNGAAPTNERGRQIAERANVLYRTFGCGPLP